MRVSLEELVRGAQRGDLDAFAELVSRFQGFVYGLAYHLSGSFEDARDLAQECFVRAYQRIGDVREPRGFPGWLRQVAVSVCHNSLPALRRGRGQSLDAAVAQGFDPPDAAPGPEAQVAQADLRDRVLAAVRALPADYALPLTLYYLDGMSSSAVGEFLGLSPGTVKMRLHRARTMVRQEMEPMFEDAFESKKLPQEFPQDVRDWIAHIEREYDQTCKLLNPEVLRFERDGGMMVAIPSEPLRYRNDRLGFLVTVQTQGIYLAEHWPFGHRVKNETVEELEPASPEQAAEWDAGRRARFLGSLPHFMHAWAYQRHEEEGFQIERPTTGLVLQPCGSRPEPLLPPEQRCDLVVPGGVLHVRYVPANEVGELRLSDGRVDLEGLAYVSGNWGTGGFWAYRSGYGLSHAFIGRELSRLREKWAAVGPLRMRRLEPAGNAAV
jgi:RNA polymerase sigma-70 factor (ECF subfamily)